MELQRVYGREVITIDGVTKTIYEWAREFGIGAETVLYRINAGWPQEAWFVKPTGRGRLTKNKEMKKRGCHNCADFNHKCPHEVCPYHELDEYKTYDEYMKKSKKNCFVKLLESLG